MIVEFDVFSGRPNPTWSLTTEQIMELQEKFQDLPPADELSGESGLGYRGFLLLNPDRENGLAPHIRIHGGIVTMTDANVQCYTDVHNIRHRLLQASATSLKFIMDTVPGRDAFLAVSSIRR